MTRLFGPRPRRSALPSALILGILAAGCAAATPSAPLAPLDPPPAEPAPEPFPHTVVWTARAGLALEDGQGRRSGPLRPFVRLEVVEDDSIGLRLRCAVCEAEGEPIEGYLQESEVVHTPLPPEVAAWGPLAEFALAIRDAAARRDLPMLAPAMAPDFVFSFIGPQNPRTAFDVWNSEAFTSLDRVPHLLDLGLSTRDTLIWSAPPAFLDDPSYGDLRLGFRRDPYGRWEWLYLIEGIRLQGSGIRPLESLAPSP